MIHNRFLAFLLIIVGSVSLLLAGESPTPWIQKFVPHRTVYVAPEDQGNGNGESAANAKSFENAIKSAHDGDLNLLLAGVYRGGFTLKKDGSSEKPIVWKAAPRAHVQVVGAIEIVAKNNWVWGLDISDPNDSSNIDSALRLWAPDAVAINNVIHDVKGKNGIGGWDQGSGQIIYGNILYNTRGIYTQNNYDEYGYKYYVANMIGDAGDPTSPGSVFNFHAYTKQRSLSGLFVKDNIFWNGRFLIGGRNEPEQNNTVRENFFYKKRIDFGFRRPTQIEFINNYVARSSLNISWLWGSGEVKYSRKKPTVFTGNEIVNPQGPTTLEVRTSAYTSSGRQEGTPALTSSDRWDNNTYTGPFCASLNANGQSAPVQGLPAWRLATQMAGNQFDVNSTIASPPTSPKVVILQNQYDPSRLHVAVFNWSNEPVVNLSSNLIHQNAAYDVYSAMNLFGEPVISGTYAGQIRLPASKEFQVFIIQLR